MYYPFANGRILLVFIFLQYFLWWSTIPLKLCYDTVSFAIVRVMQMTVTWILLFCELPSVSSIKKITGLANKKLEGKC